jgi:ketosteroid isomerase-like protein
MTKAVVGLIIIICFCLIAKMVLAKASVQEVKELFDQYISALAEGKSKQVEALWSHQKDIRMTHRFQRIGTLNEARDWKSVKAVFDGIFFAQDNRLTIENAVIATKGDKASATFDYSITLPQWGARSARSGILFRSEGQQWLIYNHAWYIQDAKPVAPDVETALTKMVSIIKEAYSKGDVSALEAISDDSHVYVSVAGKSLNGWQASSEALKDDIMDQSNLDDLTLLIAVDWQIAIALAENGTDVKASFRFKKQSSIGWQITATDLSGKPLSLPVLRLGQQITCWGKLKL